MLDQAVTCAFADGTLKPVELGGASGTAAISAAVMEAVTSGRAERAVGAA